MSRVRRLRPFAVPGLLGPLWRTGIVELDIQRLGGGLPTRRRRAHFNLSSSRFASFRSAVSMPSVNEP